MKSLQNSPVVLYSLPSALWCPQKKPWQQRLLNNFNLCIFAICLKWQSSLLNSSKHENHFDHSFLHGWDERSVDINLFHLLDKSYKWLSLCSFLYDQIQPAVGGPLIWCPTHLIILTAMNRWNILGIHVYATETWGSIKSTKILG